MRCGASHIYNYYTSVKRKNKEFIIILPKIHSYIFLLESFQKSNIDYSKENET